MNVFNRVFMAVPAISKNSLIVKGFICIWVILLSNNIANAQVNRLEANRGDALSALMRPKAVQFDCKLLHTGQFLTKINGKITKIVRTATTETDYLNGSTKNPVIYQIKWVSNCECILTPLAKTYKTHQEIPKGAIFTIDVYVRNTHSWTETISANYTQGKVNVEVTKIK